MVSYFERRIFVNYNLLQSNYSEKTFPTNKTEKINFETQLSLHKVKLCDFYRSPRTLTAATYRRSRWTPQYGSQGDIRNAHWTSEERRTLEKRLRNVSKTNISTGDVKTVVLYGHRASWITGKWILGGTF
jgi:hypothetical protein